MNILITGSSGTIGSFLKKNLTEKNHKVIGISKTGKNNSLKRNLITMSDKAITNLINKYKIDIIIHCAVLLNPKKKEDIYLNSLILNKFFINKKAKTRRFIVIGSASEYGPLNNKTINENTLPYPISDYGKSKLLQTSLCSYYYYIHGIDIVVLRLFNIISPNLPSTSFIGHVISEIKKGSYGVINISNLNIERDFLDIRDLTSLINKIILSKSKRFLYNISSGHNISYKKFIHTTEEILKIYNIKMPKIKLNLLKESINKTKCFSKLAISDFNWRPKFTIKESIDWCLKINKII